MAKTNAPVAKHGVAIIIIYVVCIWLIMQWLKSYTQHGVNVKIPDLKGKTKSQVVQLESRYPLEFIINDSVYVSTKQKNTVIDQNPAAGAEVKEGRKIYLTINATKPPMVKMPNLIDYSLRQAKAIIESYGLVLGKTTYEPDFAKDAVLKQLHKGNNIAAGQDIAGESTIDLVLGDGLKGESVDLPLFIGMQRTEARNKIKNSSLKLGAEVFDGSVTDTSKAIVYRQFPTFIQNTQVSKGRQIDLFYTMNSEKINNAKDSLINADSELERNEE